MGVKQKSLGRLSNYGSVASSKLTTSTRVVEERLQAKVNGVMIGDRLHKKQISAHQSKVLKSKDDTDFEKHLHEMTFKPKIIKKATPNRVSLAA